MASVSQKLLYYLCRQNNKLVFHQWLFDLTAPSVVEKSNFDRIDLSGKPCSPYCLNSNSLQEISFRCKSQFHKVYSHFTKGEKDIPAANPYTLCSSLWKKNVLLNWFWHLWPKEWLKSLPYALPRKKETRLKIGCNSFVTRIFPTRFYFSTLIIAALPFRHPFSSTVLAPICYDTVLAPRS